MAFHWWYIPAWIILVFITGYVWGAAKALGANDFKDGGKKK